MRAIIACAARAKERERRFRALRRPNFQIFGDSETNPLEHIVAYASLCPALGTRLGKRAERAFSVQVAVPMRLPDAARLPGSNLPQAGFGPMWHANAARSIMSGSNLGYMMAVCDRNPTHPTLQSSPVCTWHARFFHSWFGASCGCGWQSRKVSTVALSRNGKPPALAGGTRFNRTDRSNYCAR